MFRSANATLSEAEAALDQALAEGVVLADSREAIARLEALERLRSSGIDV